MINDRTETMIKKKRTNTVSTEEKQKCLISVITDGFIQCRSYC